MLEKLREFLRSGAGKALAGLVVVIGLMLAFISARGAFVNEGEEEARGRTFIDAETGKPFHHDLEMGEAIPIKAPSGKQSGYPAEACFWTKDGKTKEEPTWVFVAGVWKGSKEPTFCPDCGRLVVGHNPVPKPGGSPPPTKEEYAKNPRRPAAERQ